MTSAVPMPAEQAQVPQVLTAMTGKGRLLPVIDVTNPAFAVEDSPAAIDALRQAYLEDERRRGNLPRFVVRLLMLVAAFRSPFLRAMMKPRTTFLDGLSTYVLKLGADNLVPPFDGPLDRRIAASPGVISVRLRMQQIARLVADALARELGTAAGQPLHLVNIGGGPAVDSLNALILLQRSATNLLARPVVIHVLDVDRQGPQFGKSVLTVLRAPGGPLAGHDIELVHQLYDWNDAAPLDRLVRKLAADSAVIAASLEGALFEYASDDAVLANLRALHADGRGARFVAGSVTRADDLAQRMLAVSPYKLVPRGVATFANLAARAGFAVESVAPALLSDQVLLRPA